MSSSTFQALGHGVLSLTTSLVRQLIVLLPVALILSVTTHNLDLVWLSFPIAELFSFTLCIIFMVRVYRRDILPLKQTV